MSFVKAKQAFRENGQVYLSTNDGHLWNTNAGLLNLCEALESELDDVRRKFRELEQKLQRIEHGQRP